MGHIMSEDDGIIREIIEGLVSGKRQRGRKRETFMDAVKRDGNVCHYSELKKMAEKREDWRERGKAFHTSTNNTNNNNV